MRFLSLPKIILFFASIFSRKNCENHGFWPPKNPPKIHSKCLQNRCPTKPAFFHRFFAYFGCFRLCALFLGSAQNLAKTVVLLHYEHISIVCLSEHKATRKYRKNLPKTLPKWGPNPLKIDAKNVLFFNIVFFGFRARFWSLLGLQDGAKLAFLATRPEGSSLPRAFLS